VSHETFFLFFILFLLSSLAHADYADTLTWFRSDLPNYTNVTIQNLTVAPDPIYSGASGDFVLTLYNNGTVQANATAEVLIFNTTDDLVDSFNYSPTLISRFSQVILIKSWSTGTLPIGIYCANATAYYDDYANQSEVFSECFSVVNPPVTPPPQSPGGGGSSGGFFIPPTDNFTPPKPLPDEIIPVEGDIKFLRHTVLRELLAGTSAFESFTIRNDGGTEKTIRLLVTGTSESWVSFQPKETTLRPGEERIINFGLSVPNYALAGDYLLKLEVHSTRPTIEYMVLRVKSFPREYPYPVVLRHIRIDRLARETTVALNVRNLGTKAIPVVNVYESIPTLMDVTSQDIRFLDKPGEIIQERPLKVRWEFLNLNPNEIAYATYVLPLVLPTYSTYVDWQTDQVAVTQEKLRLLEFVEVKGLFAPELFEGEEGEVAVDVFYSGIQPLHVQAALEVPVDFELQPLEIQKPLLPRGITRFGFRVTPPVGSAGSHLFTFRLFTEDGLNAKSTPVQVRKREDDSVSTLIARFPPEVAAIIGVSIVAAAAMFVSFRKKRDDAHARKQFRQDRSDYLGQLKQMME